MSYETPRNRALSELSSRKPLHVPEFERLAEIKELYGEDVFGAKEMQAKITPSSYERFKNAVENGGRLDMDVADQIATAMKEWAISKGATHFTHWFQPLTGLTAEKHDSFITFAGPTYSTHLIMNFSGKELIKGEPDASSFPSGGIRSTFEARGYTAWDMSSPSFIRRGPNGSILCIPTAFCSWTGEALDLKTPLLRSEEALSKACVRLLHLAGDKTVKSCYSNLGCEQEFFAIDKAFYLARPDLVACGRSLIGARPAKGQEMEDHYFGSLDRRVLAFMQEVEWNLWKLGVPVRTRHNEVAPSQYETAPIFERMSIACDHNMLTMEVLREIAKKHDLVVLLHEKPFAYINGSGKHNNWSVSTDKGENLLEPGHTPANNARFLLFLAACIRAVSVHGDVLRASIAIPGNDHRLGANEAPPAIMSAYVGDELKEVIDSLIQEVPTPLRRQNQTVKLGVTSLPHVPKESSDRNRTSPFAFTGNKFEFRAVGSSQSCSRPGCFVNTVVADSVHYLADELEKELKNTGDLNLAVQNVVVSCFREHERAVFNGNGYSEEWVKEAEQRNLPNLRTTPEAIAVLGTEKNLDLFKKLGVLSPTELLGQQHAAYENYCKTMRIEASTLYNMAKTTVLPVAFEFKRSMALSVDKEGVQAELFKQVNDTITRLIDSLQSLAQAREEAEKIHEEHLHEKAVYYRKEVTEGMMRVRKACDDLEEVVDDRMWPIPKYSEILWLK